MSINRRNFLNYLLTAISTVLFNPSLAFSTSNQHSRIIPSSGERLPAVGLGSWLTFGIDVDDDKELKQRERIMREFLRRGGGVLDSSPMYGTAQEVIGRCLRNIGEYKGLFSATKVWTTGQRNGVIQMERSRLLWGLDRLDLMQVHNLLDWKVHLPTLHKMKEAGRIRYVGVTTSHGRRHGELTKIMKSQKLDFVQFTYNIQDREAENYILPLAQEKRIAVIINRPFQRGGLFEQVGNKPLPEWSEEIDCTSWAQFFLKFIISHPAVTCAIPATSRVDHLIENMNVAYGRLPDQAMRIKMLKYFQSI